MMFDKEICCLLEHALGEKMDNLTVNIHDSNKKGAGYLGNLCFITLKNKQTNEETHLVLKQVMSSGGPKSLEFNSTVFHNEMLFYNNIWPFLLNFQHVTTGNVLNIIPRCYASCSKKGTEKLILENLSFQSFHVCDKTVPLDKAHLEYIFKTFGQFHAMSFACKALNPEKFDELTAPLKNIFDYFLNGTLFFKNSMNRCFKFIWDHLESNTPETLSSKLREYSEDGPNLYSRIMNYNGRNQVLLHGDCWSNNMMFKTDGHGKVVDMRLIDFQMIRKGTPVFDLSYCFYSSASKESLRELEFFLKIYHDSLSQCLKTYNCEAEMMYPFGVLKKEWKEYCKFGFMMGMICWEQKLRYEVGIRDLSKIIDGDKSEMQKPRLFDAEKYRNITRDVLDHMYCNDFL
ncbi:uncharacterized protein [Leptinotarsa decemlineata]|uniref:uncharacterized protein n=1 Tax=Leptinotarsa decemlineata TaxID=7539 RepID=UPI000C2555B2|nr:uncharacterized protein LOC111504244 [Leptinotarsa decemlineata]